MNEVVASAATLDDELMRNWVEIAKENKVVIIAGINLYESEKYWNASVIIDEGGLVGWYAKVHLFGDEGKFFTPGELPPLVVDTSKGRIATMICYDIEFPEWVRLVMLDEAQLLAVPTNWPWMGQIPTTPPMEVVRVQAAASQNKLVIAAADRSGEERGLSWVSASVITNDEGVIQSIATTSAQIIYASVSLPTDRVVSDKNDIRGDRRPALYSRILNQ
jgi:predicted amidohydrolase